ncbi:MAG: pca operon transcription factor PcaQ [Jannaschia sp.]
MDRRIKFRHLEAFGAIARARSFKHAAEHLNLTQPAISKTLRDLEDILGVKVMERSRAGVALTPEGEIFLHFAEQSTAALRQGLHSLRGGAGATGRLRVGALPSVASTLLPQAAMAFATSDPDTLLEVHEGPHHDLTARLRSGTLDLVVGRLGRPETMAGLGFQQLYAEAVVIVAQPGSAASAVRAFDALDAFRVIYPPKDSAIRSLVARMLISMGVPLFRNRIESTSPGFGRATVMADPGSVWIISRGVVAADLAEGRLVALDIDTTPTVGAVGIMSRAEEVPSVPARAFCRVLGRLCRHEAGIDD